MVQESPCTKYAASEERMTKQPSNLAKFLNTYFSKRHELLKFIVQSQGLEDTWYPRALFGFLTEETN